MKYVRELPNNKVVIGNSCNQCKTISKVIVKKGDYLTYQVFHDLVNPRNQFDYLSDEEIKVITTNDYTCKKCKDVLIMIF